MGQKQGRPWPTELTISILIVLVLVALWLILGGIVIGTRHAR